MTTEPTALILSDMVQRSRLEDAWRDGRNDGIRHITEWMTVEMDVLDGEWFRVVRDVMEAISPDAAQEVLLAVCRRHVLGRAHPRYPGEADDSVTNLDGLVRMMMPDASERRIADMIASLIGDMARSDV